MFLVPFLGQETRNVVQLSATVAAGAMRPQGRWETSARRAHEKGKKGERGDTSVAKGEDRAGRGQEECEHSGRQRSQAEA